MSDMRVCAPQCRGLRVEVGEGGVYGVTFGKWA